jgi:hypothetical protein
MLLSAKFLFILSMHEEITAEGFLSREEAIHVEQQGQQLWAA